MPFQTKIVLIKIGDVSYTLGQIQNIDFNVVAYDGMSVSETGLAAGGVEWHE